jgi:hypothetical protein
MADTGVCAICLEPIDPNQQNEYFTDEPQINPADIELFAHGRQPGTHYVHSSCQNIYINDQEAKGIISVKCILCKGRIGSPSECRDLIIEQNRPLWDRMTRRVEHTRTSIVSYLPSRRTVVMSGLVLASITAIVTGALMVAHTGTLGAGTEVAQLPAPAVRDGRANGFNPFIMAMTWAIIMGGRNRDDAGDERRRLERIFGRDPTMRRRPYGGTRRKNKKMSRRRGGAKLSTGMVNSEESFLEFLNVISKMNKTSEPYYVMLSNVDEQAVLSFFDSLDIDPPPIVEAKGYERELMYEESDDESSTVQPPRMLVGQ